MAETNTKPNSVVTLYATEIKPGCNFYVDDIEEYLETAYQETHSCQYIKHGKEITLKLHLAQDKQTNFDYNYVRIENQDENENKEPAMYYFIMAAYPAAQHTIALSLSLDSVNSLGQATNSPANPRNFTDRTSITRQTMNRFFQPLHFDPTVGGTVRRLIDKEPEGITTVQEKKSDVKLQEHNLDWYVMYSNYGQEGKSIKVSLFADQSLMTGVASTGASVDFEALDLDEGKYYYFLDLDNEGGQFIIPGHGTMTVGGTITKCTSAQQVQVQQQTLWQTRNETEARVRGIVLHRYNSTHLEYTLLYDKNIVVNDGSNEPLTSYYGGGEAVPAGTYFFNVNGPWNEIAFITFTQANFFRVSTSNYLAQLQQPEGIRELVIQKQGIYVGNRTTQMTATIDDVDRTDPTITKIIKYPYCPVQHTVTGNVYSFGDLWRYELGYMVYQGVGVPAFGTTNTLSADLSEDLEVNIGPDDLLPMVPRSDNREAYLESKLKNSEFTTVKVSYDSFVKPIELERIVNSTNDANSLNIDFKPTSTVNSKFGFKIKPYQYHEYEDYEQYLMVTRNNEETILNSEYLNYIKTGLNYDKKANALAVEQATKQAAAGIATSVALTAANAGFGAFGAKAAVNYARKEIGRTEEFLQSMGVSGKKVYADSLYGDSVNAYVNTLDQYGRSGGIVGAIGQSTTTAAFSGLSGAVQSLVAIDGMKKQQANSIEQKQALLQQQAISVAGSDDVDLMSWYNGNRLHLYKYEPATAYRDNVTRYFELAGYSHNRREKPKVDTRVGWNFIACTPDLTIEGTKNNQRQYLTDLVERYQNGVTVLHKQLDANDEPFWDFKQEYKNMEKFLVEGV